MVLMRWGMPPPPRAGGYPVTNIRNTTSPHWRGWLKLESRCLVPANSFAEYAPEPNPATGKKDVVWFGLNDDRPLFAFAGLDRVQRRPRHEIKTYPWSASRLWLLNDCAERDRRANTLKGDAGYPDDARGIRRLDARTMG
jgi:putative SOS response-associated peptidase YedK